MRGITILFSLLEESANYRDWLVLATFVCGTGFTVMKIYGKVSPNSSKQE